MKWLLSLLVLINFSASMESQVNWTQEECERICKLLVSPNLFSCAQLAKGSRRQTSITMPREFLIGNESRERMKCVEALLMKEGGSIDTSCLYQKNVPDVTFFAYLRYCAYFLSDDLLLKGLNACAVHGIEESQVFFNIFLHIFLSAKRNTRADVEKIKLVFDGFFEWYKKKEGHPLKSLFEDQILARIYKSYGGILLHFGRPDLALNSFEQEGHLVGTNAECYFNMSSCCQRLKKGKEAEIYYQCALKAGLVPEDLPKEEEACFIEPDEGEEELLSGLKGMEIFEAIDLCLSEKFPVARFREFYSTLLIKHNHGGEYTEGADFIMDLFYFLIETNVTQKKIVLDQMVDKLSKSKGLMSCSLLYEMSKLTERKQDISNNELLKPLYDLFKEDYKKIKLTNSLDAVHYSLFFSSFESSQAELIDSLWLFFKDCQQNPLLRVENDYIFSLACSVVPIEWQLGLPVDERTLNGLKKEGLDRSNQFFKDVSDQVRLFYKKRSNSVHSTSDTDRERFSDTAEQTTSVRSARKKIRTGTAVTASASPKLQKDRLVDDISGFDSQANYDEACRQARIRSYALPEDTEFDFDIQKPTDGSASLQILYKIENGTKIELARHRPHVHYDFSKEQSMSILWQFYLLKTLHEADSR